MNPIARFEPVLALTLAAIWISPLIFAFWAAFHSSSDAVNFNLAAPWTLENFRTAWAGAPWLRYFLNTFLLVTLILAGQFLLCTLAGFAFAQTAFRGRDALFIVVLLQLFILPEVRLQILQTAGEPIVMIVGEQDRCQRQALKPGEHLHAGL